MNIKNRMDILRASSAEDINVEMETRHLNWEGLNRLEMIIEILAHDLYMEKLGEMENAESSLSSPAPQKIIYFDATKMSAYPMTVNGDQLRMLYYLLNNGPLKGHIYYASDMEEWVEV